MLPGEHGIVLRFVCEHQPLPAAPAPIALAGSLGCLMNLLESELTEVMLRHLHAAPHRGLVGQ